MFRKKSLLAGIDVGSSVVRVVISRQEEGRIRVLGTGQYPSLGMKQGRVVNLRALAKSISCALEFAEERADLVVASAVVSVGSPSLRALNRSVRVAASESIGPASLRECLELARDCSVPPGYEIVHTLIRDFSVDGQPGVVDPVGFTGEHLKLRAHVVIDESVVVQNVKNAVNDAGVSVDRMIVRGLAAGESSLNPDEKELGVIVVDIGGGTTAISAFLKGRPCYSAVLGVGGDLVTRDLARGLRIPLQEAENLKETWSEAGANLLSELSDIQPWGMTSGRTTAPPQELVNRIINSRQTEFVKVLTAHIKQIDLSLESITGVVFVGGGALLEGLVGQAREELGVPARLGYPVDFLTEIESISDPSYCTALGLLRCASEMKSTIDLEVPERTESRWSRLIERIKRLLLDSATGETVNFNRSAIFPLVSVSELPKFWTASWSAGGKE